MIIKIAITDDHKMVLKGITSMLQNTPDVQVVGTYENAKQTLDNIESDKPDVLN